MTFPTVVNDQVTDAVTQANAVVTSDASAMAMAPVFQTLAHSTGLTFANAVSIQAQQNGSALAYMNQCVRQIYSPNPMPTAAESEIVAQDAVVDNFASTSAILPAMDGEGNTTQNLAAAANLAQQAGNGSVGANLSNLLQLLKSG